MPELSRFLGIIIRMYMEPTAIHNLPHFHVYYNNFAAVIGIEPIEVIAGELPRKQLRLVFAWAELHQDELINDWNLLQSGRLPLKIDPLK